MAVTNEALVLEIQQGNTELLGLLWEQVQRFVHRKAKEALAGLPPGCGCEEDDLVQSGYIAMVAAVQTYDPGQSSFLHWLAFHLKHEFCASGGYPAMKHILPGESGEGRERWVYRNPLNNCASLDTPLSSTEEDGTVLSDILPYERAGGGDEYEDLENEIYRDQLRAALNHAMDRLPGKQAAALRRRYWDGQAYQQIAEARGVSYGDVVRDVRDGLRTLRAPAHRAELEQFLEENIDYYAGSGFRKFARVGASSVEQAVLRRENLTHKWRRSCGEG